MKSYKFIITGKVQGVYYRVSVQNNALKANYKGYVKNLADKSVEACVTCQDEELSGFIKILQKGSIDSEVLKIEQFDCEEVFTQTFEVR
jgi:acylphosphatase